MRRSIRWFLIAVLVLDAVGAAALLGSAMSSAEAQTPGDEAEPVPEQDALLLLGKELAQRAADLEQREGDVLELLRGAEVLKRAGIDPQSPAVETAVAEVAEQEPILAASGSAFEKLQRAYENMEPESAALALTRLADRDQDAVVQLLLGWQPRTTGAILDALAQSNPQLAADLSYEIWKGTGKNGTAAASSGR